MIRLQAVSAALLVITAVTAVTACGTVKTNSEGGADGGAPGGDGGGPGDAEGLPAISGTWSFHFEDSDGTQGDTCAVLIDDAGGWTVNCPYEVNPDFSQLCYQSAGRTELTGTWNDLFEGSTDDVAEYTGTCEQAEVRTTSFTMVADRAAGVADDGFMARLAGSWAWVATDAEDATQMIGCSAAFTPTATSLDFVVTCESEPRTVSPGCLRYDTIDIRGGIEATHFQAEMSFPASFDPADCGTYEPPGTLSLIADRTGD